MVIVASWTDTQTALRVRMRCIPYNVTAPLDWSALHRAAQVGAAAAVRAEEERYKQLADDLERTAKASEALDPHTNYGAW